MGSVAERADAGVSIGRIYSRAFGTIASNPAVALGLAFLFGALPGLGMAFLMPILLAANGSRGFSLALAFSSVVIWVVSLAIAALTQAVLTRATVAHFEGRKASFGESIGAGMAVLVQLIVLVILIGICAGLGFLFFIVPGVILYCMWAVASPALVEERPSIMGALSRSRELTRGHRWKVLGALLLMLVIYWLISALAGMVGLSSVRAGADPAAFFTTGFIVSSVVLGTLTNVIWGTMQASMYVELREAHDGPGHAQLEDVFA